MFLASLADSCSLQKCFSLLPVHFDAQIQWKLLRAKKSQKQGAVVLCSMGTWISQLIHCELGVLVYLVAVADSVHRRKGSGRQWLSQTQNRKLYLTETDETMRQWYTETIGCGEGDSYPSLMYNDHQSCGF